MRSWGPQDAFMVGAMHQRRDVSAGTSPRSRREGRGVAALPRAVASPLATRQLHPHHVGLMTTSTWLTMVGIMAYVWGGFSLALRKAIRSESQKTEE